MTNIRFTNVNGYIWQVFHHFAKGDNFCCQEVAFLVSGSFQKYGLFYPFHKHTRERAKAYTLMVHTNTFVFIFSWRTCSGIPSELSWLKSTVSTLSLVKNSAGSIQKSFFFFFFFFLQKIGFDIPCKFETERKKKKKKKKKPEEKYKFVICCFYLLIVMINVLQKHIIQRTIKTYNKTMWPVKTQISLYIQPIWQGFSFIPLWIARRL